MTQSITMLCIAASAWALALCLTALWMIPRYTTSPFLQILIPVLAFVLIWLPTFGLEALFDQEYNRLWEMNGDWPGFWQSLRLPRRISGLSMFGATAVLFVLTVRRRKDGVGYRIAAGLLGFALLSLGILTWLAMVIGPAAILG